MKLEYLFGKPPKTIIRDHTDDNNFNKNAYHSLPLEDYLEALLQMEAVACKDWLTNKVDRSVTGRVAKQQTAGSVQLPLNNLGVIALDYRGQKGIATSIGHAPVAALIDPESGSRLAIAEALTNIIWAPLREGIKGISLSANWMWPSKNPGEDARLYRAVKAVSEMAIDLGINIPTGKDSLSMTQKYPDGQSVLSPGTVIITAVSEVTEITKIVEPVLITKAGTGLLYINMSGKPFSTGGSSFSMLTGTLGNECPDVDVSYFKKAFITIQEMINRNEIISGHDISSGGLITSLLEMTFCSNTTGMNIDLSGFPENDLIKILFSENPGLILQVDEAEKTSDYLNGQGVINYMIGNPAAGRRLKIYHHEQVTDLDINKLRDLWFNTSWLLDKKQTAGNLADLRFKNYKKQELRFEFNPCFKGSFESLGIDPGRKNKTGIRAAIIREKGVNGDREMAYAMHLAGFDVKDVHMTDLASGRENLTDINFIVFVGGFSNSDVLGSAKGWAGAFLYNEKAKIALENFFKREDTLSLGVCNGCQVVVELGLIYPEHELPPKMLFNESHKFESGFINVDVLSNHSIMLHSLAGSRLGIWVAHGEGKFSLPYAQTKYHIPIKYAYNEYPGNPNGSDFSTAAICSSDGRHLAMMPHLERAFLPWQWAHYPDERKSDQLTPWMEAFVNARDWIKKIK